MIFADNIVLVVSCTECIKSNLPGLVQFFDLSLVYPPCNDDEEWEEEEGEECLPDVNHTGRDGLEDE